MAVVTVGLAAATEDSDRGWATATVTDSTQLKGLRAPAGGGRAGLTEIDSQGPVGVRLARRAL